MPYSSDKRLYLAEDGETVVEEGDPRAATLLVGEGGQLSDEDAARYGLPLTPAAEGAPAPGERYIAPDEAPRTAEEATPMQEGEAEEDAAAVREKTEAKAKAAPPENKARRSPPEEK